MNYVHYILVVLGFCENRPSSTLAILRSKGVCDPGSAARTAGHRPARSMWGNDRFHKTKVRSVYAPKYKDSLPPLNNRSASDIAYPPC